MVEKVLLNPKILEVAATIAEGLALRTAIRKITVGVVLRPKTSKNYRKVILIVAVAPRQEISSPPLYF